MRKKHTTELFIEDILCLNMHPIGKYNYRSVEYVGATNKIKIFCNDCKDFFLQSPSHHKWGYGCSKCGNMTISQKLSYNTEKFIENILCSEIHLDGKYNYKNTKYIRAHNNIEIYCNDCKKSFWQGANNHKYGEGCPYCNLMSGSSKQEIEIVEYIKSIYSSEIITNTRKIIKPYELDIYLPEKRLAFEYNGLYWHQEGVNKPIGYHQMKIDLCKEKHINLIHIWDHDWLDDKKFMKECIKREINS